MPKLPSFALGVVVLLAVSPAFGQSKGTATVRVRMARAICTTGPCNPFFNFRAGSAQFKRMKQSKVLTRRSVGRLRLDGVSSTAPSGLPTSLDGLVTARVNYAPVDPDSDCAAVGSDSTFPIATSSLSCRQRGATTVSCRGDIVLEAGVLDDPDCTDVQQTFSDVVVEVFEDGGVGDDSKKIAQDGILMTGKTPDCDSGGSGCP